MASTARHRSASTLKSLWQEYSVFDDRLEFRTHLGRWCVPFSEIDEIEVAEARVPALLHGRIRLDDLLAFKLDLADLAEHVAIDRNTGIARRVVFTPEDPDAFVRAARAALEAWRGAASS